MTVDRRVSIVVLTHNRLHELDRNLRRLLQLEPRPAIIVVDNASTDGSAEHVGRWFPSVEVVRCPRNIGAAARNEGVRRVQTPYVAFCDDDTWWADGALQRAAGMLHLDPRLAAVAARVLVGPQQRTDPACERMAATQLGRHEGRPRLLGFMAGAVVMRTAAFRAAGGYEPRFFLGAEETLLGLDLDAAGWRMVYAGDVVTHHQPAGTGRDPRARQVLSVRNRIWTAWMRLPWPDLLRETGRQLAGAARGGVLGASLLATLRGAGWAWRGRRPLGGETVQLWRRARRLQQAAPRRRPAPA